MDAKNKIYSLLLVIMALVTSFLATPRTSFAACSEVKIEILQELTLERIAFDAKMVITNNIPDKDLSNIRVDVSIRDGAGNVKDSIFFTRVSSLQNIAAVDGTGTVLASSTSEIHWLIIPSSGAGGAETAGNIYWVGATLTYTVDGKQEVISVNPDRIIVKPEPQLILDYFTPYEVLGDNPFTPQVEAPVPYPLAVRVLNAGYGTATNLKIESAQPKIVENTQGLLIDFKLLGAAVNDSAVSPSLTVAMGNLGSMKIATGYWEMISTLSGHITEFKATFSHASDLGGELTSLIKETNTHYLIHRVKVNLPGRDGLLDFLADTDRDPDHLPDAIFESEIPGNTGKTEDSRSPVTVVAVTAAPVRPTTTSPEVQMTVQTGQAGWIYAKISDPAQGLLKLLDVVRADGVHLDPHNFWIQEGLDRNYKKIFTLNILDYRSDAGSSGTYNLVYTQPAEDSIPPSTKLIFDGPSTGTDPQYYITPATTIILSATDNDGGSGVDQMFKKLTGKDNDFISAYPFTIEDPGTYTLEYYSVDRAGNLEVTKTATIEGLPLVERNNLPVRGVTAAELKWAGSNSVPMKIYDLRDEKKRKQEPGQNSESVAGKTLDERVEKLKSILTGKEKKKDLAARMQKPQSVVLIFSAADDAEGYTKKIVQSAKGDIRYLIGGYEATISEKLRKQQTAGACPTCPGSVR